jgi:hypothetical protein|tara:strand:+ start:28 stop:210 length:183 start_codon:yes stop_codon:yes gene_type:complete
VVDTDFQQVQNGSKRCAAFCAEEFFERGLGEYFESVRIQILENKVVLGLPMANPDFICLI